ncbi:MAG: amidohydrolase [Candidatus Izemoplasmatales bacterium]|nr:amidohydrolase [Candidatus Izemoplasmatales bacterium]
MRIPAFIDSHLHMLGIGYYDEIINLVKAKSIDEIKSLLLKSERDIIIARGFNQENLIEKRMPNKNDFSSIEKPLVLFRICGHVAVVNQRMLDLLGIDVSTKQVSGGSFDIDSGLFQEKSLSLIYQAMPKPNKEDLKRYLIKANKKLIENGITKVASDDFSSFGVPYEVVIEAINEVDEAGLLDVEITEQVNLPIEELRDFINKGYARKVYKNFKMGPLKILGDGSIGGRTAALNKPYDDDPLNIGILTYTDNELSELVELASQNNMDTVIHAIGDRAVDQAIKVIKEAQDKYPRKAVHNAIIHAQVTNKKQIDLMSKAGIGAIVQPIFINTDIKVAKERLGKRSEESYLFKTMYDKLRLGFSTDSPVETVNPMHNIYTAIARKSIDFPEYEPFLPSESFSIEEAIKAYTKNNLPYVYSKAHQDYIEIDQDIFRVKYQTIKDIIVLKVYKNNKLIYERKN